MPVPSPLNNVNRPAPAARDDAASQALRARFAAALADVRGLPEVQAAIVVAQREALAALKRMPGDMYSHKWYEQREREIKAQAAQALDAAESAAVERLAALREQAEAATRRDPGSVADQQLNELRIQSEWLSLKQILDVASQQVNPLAAIELAAERAASDPTRAEALRRFASDYVAANFAGQPRHARENIENALAAGVTRAESANWSASQHAAHEALSELDRATMRLQVNAREARREIEGRGVAAALAGWDDGQTIPLTERGQPVPAVLVQAALGDGARAWSASAARTYPLLTEAGAQAPTTDPARNRTIAAAQRLGMDLAVE